MSFYLGTEPVPQAILRKESTTLTAGQTVINTGGYSNGDLIQVSLNGVIIEGSGVDYTASNGSDITLTVAGSAGDVLQFQTFDAFELVGSKFSAPTITNDVTLKNNTEEDTDGGRSSKLVYKGEQSGGQESTLAEIQASHDGSSNDEKGSLSFKTNDGNDGASPTEAARIDSSRNFLIGTTGSDPHNASASSDLGVAIRNDGRIHAGATGQNALALNRLDDGAIVTLKKGGVTAGSIGVTANITSIVGKDGNGGIAIQNNSYGDIVYPTSNLTGGASDNAIDLGYNNGRWKDLYLSGGAYIGGTVAANQLTDYEQGTWNVSLSGVTVSGGTVEATYVKVGNLVTAIASFTNVTISGGNTVTITGLPFTAAIRSTSSHPALYYHANGAEPVYALLEKNTANMFLQYNRSNNSWASATITSGSNRYIHFSITYTV